MHELLKVNYDTEQPTVSARELHDGLEVSERFQSWFNRQLQYGFEENSDYVGCKEFNALAKQELQDYQISIDMAKQICMIQRSEKGRQYRQYFLDLEKAWNTPEQVMARALKMANRSIDSLKERCRFLGEQVIENQKIISEMRPKVNYVDMVLQSKSLVRTTQIAKDYGISAKKLNQILKDLRIQYKVGNQWVLYAKYQNNGYAHSRTINITRSDGRADVVMQTEWTQKGRLFLYEVLKKNGYIPVIERSIST